MVKTLPRHAVVWRHAASRMSGSGQRFPSAIPTYDYCADARSLLSPLQGSPMQGFGVPIRCKGGTAIANLSSQLHQHGAAKTYSCAAALARANPFA